MKLSEVLKNNTMISIATVDEEGKPKLRTFNHQFIVDGKICFATSNLGGAYSELKDNPNAEIMQFARAMYTRVAGEVKFAEGALKDELKGILEKENPTLVNMYTKEGFDEKIEVGYFIDPVIRVMDFKTREKIEVEID